MSDSQALTLFPGEQPEVIDGQLVLDGTPTLVRLDDWEVLYGPDGQRMIEGHRIDIRDLRDALGLDLEIKFATPAYDAKVSEEGAVPASLHDIPEGAIA